MLGPEGLARSDYVGVVSWRGLRVGGSDYGREGSRVVDGRDRKGAI